MSRATVVRVLKWISLVGVFGGLLIPLVFIKEVIFPFVFSKLIVFQLLVGLTFPAYALLAWMEPEYRPKKHPVLLALLAYFIAMGLSVAFSVDPFRSWWGNQERMNGFFTLLHFLAWLLMMTGLLRDWRDWERFLRFQVVAGGAVALTAVWQRWVDPELFYYHAGERVGGVLDNPIYMGMYQMFSFFLLGLLAFRTRSWGWRAAYAVLTLFGLGGFLASQSRGPLVGLFVGLAAFAFFYAWLSGQRRARIASAALVGTALIGYGGLYLARGTELVERLGLARFVSFSTTTSTRLIAWKIAWRGFLERPFFGWGLDTFHLIFNLHYNPQSLRYSLYETWFDRAHNTVLDVLSMTGILGFVTYIVIFVAIGVAVFRAHKKGWIDAFLAALLLGLPVAYFVQNLFVFDHPAGFILSYLLFGFVIGATRPGFSAESAETGPSVAVPRPFPVALAVPLALASLLLVWRTSYLPFHASTLSIAASQAFPSASALEKMRSAMGIWTPYRDEQMFLLSRSLIGAGQGLKNVPGWQDWLAIAKDSGRQEVDRHPKNAYGRYIYARLLADTAFAVPEQVAQAEAEYRLAIDSSPRRQQLYESLSQLYLRTGRSDEALKAIKEVQDADPENGYGDWLAGVVTFFDLGKEQEGARLIVSALEKPFPKHLENVREYVPVFHAYRVLGRGAELDRWASLIEDDTTAGDGPFYQFAYQSRLAGRKDLEARFVAQVERLFPGSKQKYESSVREIEAQKGPSVPARSATSTR